mmetsp:Transcript_26119/g.71992  ORF Transcript_26119/g.71992 Transcript_26119/m.71992 type:complete len:282 (-) Transcript_26119:408-1253(-)
MSPIKLYLIVVGAFCLVTHQPSRVVAMYEGDYNGLFVLILGVVSPYVDNRNGRYQQRLFASVVWTRFLSQQLGHGTIKFRPFRFGLVIKHNHGLIATPKTAVLLFLLTILLCWNIDGSILGQSRHDADLVPLPPFAKGRLGKVCQRIKFLVRWLPYSLHFVVMTKALRFVGFTDTLEQIDCRLDLGYRVVQVLFGEIENCQLCFAVVVNRLDIFVPVLLGLGHHVGNKGRKKRRLGRRKGAGRQTVRPERVGWHGPSSPLEFIVKYQGIDTKTESTECCQR